MGKWCVNVCVSSSASVYTFSVPNERDLLKISGFIYYMRAIDHLIQYVTIYSFKIAHLILVRLLCAIIIASKKEGTAESTRVSEWIMSSGSSSVYFALFFFYSSIHFFRSIASNKKSIWFDGILSGLLDNLDNHSWFLVTFYMHLATALFFMCLWYFLSVDFCKLFPNAVLLWPSTCIHSFFNESVRLFRCIDGLCIARIRGAI